MLLLYFEDRPVEEEDPAMRERAPPCSLSTLRRIGLPAICAAMLLCSASVSCGRGPDAASPPATSPPIDEPPTAERAVQSSSRMTEPNGSLDDEANVVTEDDLLDISHPLEGHRAPDIVGVQSWIGSSPVDLLSLRGKVVLVDFWTYSCINCIRTIPFILEWREKYRGLGLHIIGVHTPEFDFEKDVANVEAAVERIGITYPVALDNAARTWEAFDVQAWPTKYLIDADGVIQYAEAGEGGYVAVEQSIRYWLRRAGYDVSTVQFEPDDYYLDPEIDIAARVEDRELARTREIYAGYRRNLPFHRFPPPRPWILYDHYYENLDSDVLFEDAPLHENQRLYAHGLWHTGPESLTHARPTENFEDYLAIKFNAKTVNAVLGHDGGPPYRVRVTLDGKPLRQDQADADIRFDEMGNSYAEVDRARMYRLIRMQHYEQHELRISSNSDRFELFTFTFGAYRRQEDN